MTGGRTTASTQAPRYCKGGSLVHWATRGGRSDVRTQEGEQRRAVTWERSRPTWRAREMTSKGPIFPLINDF